MITGRTIRRVRRGKKISLEALAKRVGVSAMQLSRIERGQRGTSLETLLKIARLLGLK